jgi:hypothetical protein
MPKNNTREDSEKSGGGSVDLNSILLPDKKLHTPGEAQRVEAGVLLHQEQQAIFQPNIPPAPKPPTAQPVLAKDTPIVESLETFQSDIQKAVKEQSVSSVFIASSEARRREEQRLESKKTSVDSEDSEHHRRLGSRVIFIGGGVLLIALAASITAYAILRPDSVAVSVAISVPFITVDDSKSVILEPNDSPQTVMNDLLSTAKNEVLSTGLIAAITPAEASSTNTQTPAAYLSAQQFLPLLAPNIPDTLVRTLEPNFLLGLHSFNNTNQPFLILSVDSYEQGYAGMLSWEQTMSQDLAPLFPTTSALPAPSTPTATSTQIVTTGFSDQEVGNHDARVLLDTNGNIILLWTFLDRQTIVITTNPYTLGEIISRLKVAPITPVPGQ